MIMNPDQDAVKAQLKAALRLLQIMCEAIKEATIANGGIPSGHLYSALQSHMDLQGYNSALQRLKGTELVVEKANHMLVWVGPMQ